jgi:hypothetical protein
LTLERTPASPFSRRRLLQISGVGGLALASGSVLFMWGGGEHYRALLPAGVTPVVLSEKELAILFALVDRLLPAAPGFVSAREARIAERVDRELGFHPRTLQQDVKAALLLVEHGGLLHLSATRFTRLSQEDQDLRLQEMMTRGLDVERQAFGGLRLMAMFFYYCDERTWGPIHYEGPLVQVASPPLADSRVAPRPPSDG